MEEMPPDRSFRLDRTDCFWGVEKGNVDIFSVAIENGRIIGRRSRLCSVNAGGVIFPVTPADKGRALCFIAVPSPNAELVSYSAAVLSDVSRDPVLAGHLEKAVEKWVLELVSEFRSGPQPPIHSIQLEEAQTLDLKAGQVFHSRYPVIWIHQIEGASRFMGNEKLQLISAGDYFPLPAGCWLEAMDDSRMGSNGFAGLLSYRVGLWECLTRFHDLIYELALMERQRREGLDRIRVSSSIDEERLLAQSAINRLGSVLEKSDVSYEGSTPDSVLQACQLIGHAMGIVVRSPNSISSGRGMEEALRIISNASNFRTRQILLKGKWWKDNHGPLLGKLIDSDSPVALIPDRSGSYQLHDPATGEKVPLDWAVREKLGSRAFMFYRPFPAGPLTTWSLFSFGLAGCWQDIRLILLLAIGSGIVGALIPMATGVLYDSVIPSANRSLLIQMVTGLVIGSLTGGIFQLVQGLAQLRFLGRMEANVEAALWDRLLNLPPVFFRRFSSGDLADRAFTVFEIQQRVSGAVLMSILSGIFCTFNVALLFYYASGLAMSVMGILSIAVLVMLGLFYLQLGYQKPLLGMTGKISNFNIQILSSIAKLRANAAEMRAFEKWSIIYSQLKGFNLKYRKVNVITSIFQASLPLTATLAVFGQFALAWKPDALTIRAGEFLAFNAAMAAVIAAVMSALGNLASVLSVIPMYERMKPIISEEPEIHTGHKDPGKLTGSIEMAHVNFRYKPDGPQILKDVSIKADPGEFIALVGPSGSGKSTILRLLIQFETSESGSIFYDGQSMAELDVQAVRRQCGVVLQGGRLLSGSIYECITGGLPLATEEAWEAARMASLDEDIRAMPMGMHTIIGDGGSVLSGGQRQRLLIARAIVKKPRIVFFDEATSALDNISQAQVSKSLEDLQATRIVIAHRLSTIRNADRIYVLVKGQVMESGSYDELMARQGVFSDLAKRQIA